MPGRKFKHNPRAIALRAQAVNPPEAIAHFKERTVAKTTRDSYASHVKFIEEFLQGYPDGTTLTLGIFAQMLFALAETSTGGTSTANGYRSAVRFHQLTYGRWLAPDGEAWAESEECIAICNGFKYNGKRGNGPRYARGTLDSDMLQGLLQFAGKPYPELVTPMRIGALVSLRPHQLAAINKGCYDPATRKLLVPDKVANASNGKPFWSDKDVMDDDAHAILEALEAITDPGQPYFSKLSLPRLRQCIKEAAVALGWHDRFPGLKFDGPHCLRHAGTLLHTTRLTAEGHSLSSQAEKLKMSTRMVGHYQTTNAKRMRSVAKRQDK